MSHKLLFFVYVTVGKLCFSKTTMIQDTNNICIASYFSTLMMHAEFVCRIAAVEEKLHFPICIQPRVIQRWILSHVQSWSLTINCLVRCLLLC